MKKLALIVSSILFCFTVHTQSMVRLLKDSINKKTVGYFETTVNGRARLFKEPNHLSGISIRSLQKNDSIQLISFCKSSVTNDFFWELSTKEFVHEMNLNETPEIIGFKEPIKIRLMALGQEILKYEILENEKKSKAYINSLYSRFGKSIAEKLLEGSIWFGMTDEMARISVGKPDVINETVTKYIRSEQWVYRGRELYLYFDNGILRSYQQSR